MKISRISGVLFLGVALVLSASFTEEAKVKQQRRPSDLDVLTPINNIVASLKSLFDGSVDLGKLIAAVLKLLPCLPQDESFGSRMNEKDLESAFNLLSDDLKNITLNQLNLDHIFADWDFATYCQTDDFKSIHNYIWVEDKQLEDVVHFFWKVGHKGAYDVVRQIYSANSCPQELIDTLPTAPEAKTLRLNMNRNIVEDRSFIREQMLNERHAVAPKQAECNLIEILLELVQAGVLNLLQFVQTLLTEINTKPSLHFLLGKIQEPVKKDSFREFRKLIAVQELLHKAHQALLANEDIYKLLVAIKDSLGLDLIETNIFEVVVGFLEYLLWGQLELMPPYVPTTTPAAF